MFKFFRFFRAATPKKVLENEQSEPERKSIDLGPVQIDEVFNEWSKKHFIECVERERRNVPDIVPEEGNDQPHKD